MFVTQWVSVAKWEINSKSERFKDFVRTVYFILFWKCYLLAEFSLVIPYSIKLLNN